MRLAAALLALLTAAVVTRAEAAPGGQGAGVRLGDLTWPEAEKVLTPQRVVVLPLGAGAKEHGPHLLLRNDQAMADYWAERVRAVRPVALLPTLTYAYYPYFLEYPGSTSLTLETQREVVLEIVRSIAHHGPRRFYVLNTGVRPVDALEPAREILAGEGILLGYTDVKKAGHAVEQSVRQSHYGTHADEIETSQMLYIDPSLVHMDRAVADGKEEGSAPSLVRERGRPGHYSPSGVWGDPTLATREKGQKVTEAILADVLQEIDALAVAPLPAGTPRPAVDLSPLR